MKILPLSNLVVRVSNRKLLGGLISSLELEENAEDIFSIIDHAEKVPREKTISALQELGLNEEDIVKITTFMNISGSIDEVRPQLEALDCSNKQFKTGVIELSEIMKLLELKIGQNDSIQVEADMLIVRGLDYYTGTVFETFANDHREIGSLCSGGRYENLASNYTDQKFPGVGGSIGLTRLFWILQNYQLINLAESKPIDVCVIPFSNNELALSEELANNLRKTEQKVDVIVSDKKLGDRLKYASKIANFATVIGENEAKSRKYELKNLETGEKETRSF